VREILGGMGRCLLAAPCWGPGSHPTPQARGGELFQLSAWYPGVATKTQEVGLKTKLYLEFGEISKDGSLVTL